MVLKIEYEILLKKEITNMESYTKPKKEITKYRKLHETEKGNY